jgi:outer membrane protein OmpA-like peptidoglycan-associated protein/tetratricopeptide (TPR) repeat protein
MRKGIKFLAVALLSLAAAACASPEKMAEMANNVTVKCDPAVLEVVAGEINATVTVTYPKDYFHPKAILEVTPVLVYEGGEAKMTPFTYQGEKVKDNYTVVSSNGGTVTEKVHFDYVPGMEKCYLELRGVAKVKAKSATLPSKKVAEGANTTYMLIGDATKAGEVSYKADNYQPVIEQTEEGQILYKINKSDVQKNELKSESVRNFQKALDDIKANDRQTLKSTQVVAYASPDGGEKLNAKLSDKRSESAYKAWKQITKGKEVASPEVKSVGQDWEGFQKLVTESNIQDKDLILRVLSMYSDPAVRESEIKNMSEVFTDLKGSVLPELRRARFIANVEYKNYTDEELTKMVEEDSDVLDEEALLHAASLVKAPAQKEALYKKAVEKYNSDRAQFNLGVVYLNQGKNDKAEDAFAKVTTKDNDLENALGVLALRKGDKDGAAKHFAKAGEAGQANQGVLDILNGNYDKAAKELANSEGHAKVLAYILTNQLDKASAAATCGCPKMAYLKAIIAARQGNASAVKSNLETASKAKFFKERAAKDIEFAEYNK